MNTNRTTTRVRLAVLGVAALPLVLACGSESADGGEGSGERSAAADESADPEDDGALEGAPDETDEDQAGPGDLASSASVSWDGDQLHVVVAGSSSCPPKARDLEVVEPDEWVIDVTPRTKGNQPCTMDLVPSSSRIAAPPGASTDAEVTVVLVDGDQRSEPIPVEPGA
jgi:hypothetical protein